MTAWCSKVRSKRFLLVACGAKLSVQQQERPMAQVKYEVVEHDGGWAYKVGGTFSETFASHDTASAAAHKAAAEQQIGGRTTGISYEDSQGVWHEEIADGGDRPGTEVED
jgi:hypothetical protein